MVIKTFSEHQYQRKQTLSSLNKTTTSHTGMWSLRLGRGLIETETDRQRKDSLVVSGINHCRIIELYGDEAEEVNLEGFETEERCLYAANVVNDQVVQVTFNLLLYFYFLKSVVSLMPVRC